jgi:hypothetical protein
VVEFVVVGLGVNLGVVARIARLGNLSFGELVLVRMKSVNGSSQCTIADMSVRAECERFGSRHPRECAGITHCQVELVIYVQPGVVVEAVNVVVEVVRHVYEIRCVVTGRRMEGEWLGRWMAR